MTFDDVIKQIETYKAYSAEIATQYKGLKEIEWWISDLPPQIIDQVAIHYKSKWFKCTREIAVIVSAGVCQVTLFSTPIEVKQSLEFVPIN